jgi:four helix bundle protein
MGDFKQLAVWKRAYNLAIAVYRATGSFPLAERFGLASQLRRATVSVASNIAEGCGRQGDAELARFLRLARGSISEVECQLLLARDLGFILREAWLPLNTEAQEISRMLNGLVISLRRRRASSQ